LEAIGVNLKDLLATHVESIEEVFEMVESIIETVRKSDKDRPVCIVVDSIAGASTKNELEGNYDKTGYATDKSIIMGQALRKITNMIGRERICLICTNQLRYKMNVIGFQDPYTTSGGKAMAFHASVRIRIKSIGQIKATQLGVQMTIGIKSSAEVIKNRVGPPKRKAKFDIYFNRGIDDTPSWLAILENLKIISPKVQGVYTLREDMHGKLKTKLDGKKLEAIKINTPEFIEYMKNNKQGKKANSRERIKFKAGEFYSLLEHPEYYKFIYDTICNASIMLYKNAENKISSMDPDELIHVDENDEIIVND
jgi:recombination protein RecA